MPLYARVFTSDLTTPVFLEEFTDIVEDINFVWALHGGLQSMEIELSCNSLRAYIFYRRYLGKRIVIDDHIGDRPVGDGFLTDATINRNGATLIVSGFWFRHSDEMYAFDDTDWEYGLAPIGSYVRYNPTGRSIVDYGEGDPSQDFSDWETAVAPAIYYIEVLNTDGTYCWGFMGAAFTTYDANDSVYVYTDYGLTTPGWNETAVTGKVIESYAVYLVTEYKTTSECIEDALAEAVPCMSTSYVNIDDTELPVGRYTPPIEEGGMYPAAFIEKMASMSNGDNKQWNYWVANDTYDNGAPQKPIPYFKEQVDDGTYDWVIDDASISSDTDIATRGITELRNYVMVLYRDMEDSDLIKPTDPASDATSISDFWLREVMISGGDNTEETANTYRDMYLHDFKNPRLGLPIEISSASIPDSRGNPYPLWAPIKYNAMYFRYTNLFPEYGMTSRSADGMYTGQAMNMEYSYKSNSLKVTLDTESNQLDAIIARIDMFV